MEVFTEVDYIPRTTLMSFETDSPEKHGRSPIKHVTISTYRSIGSVIHIAGDIIRNYMRAIIMVEQVYDLREGSLRSLG